MANNADWLNTLNYIDFLRDVGRHFSVNRMLSFDSVKMRLERQQELSFLEFNYMILQAYDFVELNKRHGCVLQMGGSDQWGNIVNGIDLGRRMSNVQLFALTSPLITTVVRRQDGQDRGRRGLAQRRPASAPTTTGNTGATPRTATWRASSSCSRCCRSTRSPSSRRCKAPSSTRRRRCWRPKRPRWCMAAPPPTRPPAPRARPSRKARSPRTCRRVEIARAEMDRPRRARQPLSAPASSPRTAKRAARSRPAASGSTMPPSPTRRWC